MQEPRYSPLSPPRTAGSRPEPAHSLLGGLPYSKMILPAVGGLTNVLCSPLSYLRDSDKGKLPRGSRSQEVIPRQSLLQTGTYCDPRYMAFFCYTRRRRNLPQARSRPPRSTAGTPVRCKDAGMGICKQPEGHVGSNPNTPPFFSLSVLFLACLTVTHARGDWLYNT